MYAWGLQIYTLWTAVCRPLLFSVQRTVDSTEQFSLRVRSDLRIFFSLKTTSAKKKRHWAFYNRYARKNMLLTSILLNSNVNWIKVFFQFEEDLKMGDLIYNLAKLSKKAKSQMCNKLVKRVVIVNILPSGRVY